MTSAVDWKTNLVMPRGKRNQELKDAPPRGKVRKSAESAQLQVLWGGDRAQPHQENLLRLNGTAQSAQVSYCMLTCPVGGWGATQKVSVCEV